MQEQNNASHNASKALSDDSNGIATPLQGTNNALQGHSKGIAKASQARRKALPTPSQGHSKTPEALTLRCFVTGTQVNISEKRFPVYGLFTLAIDSTEIFIKTSKSECVSLSSQQRFSTNVQGFPVTLV